MSKPFWSEIPDMGLKRRAIKRCKLFVSFVLKIVLTWPLEMRWKILTLPVNQKSDHASEPKIMRVKQKLHLNFYKIWINYTCILYKHPSIPPPSIYSTQRRVSDSFSSIFCIHIYRSCIYSVTPTVNTCPHTCMNNDCPNIFGLGLFFSLDFELLYAIIIHSVSPKWVRK